MHETGHTQVTRKHFKDLTYVRVNGEDSCLQKLIVYTESENDKNLLMVRLVFFSLEVISFFLFICLSCSYLFLFWLVGWGAVWL